MSKSSLIHEVVEDTFSWTKSKTLHDPEGVVSDHIHDLFIDLN